MNHSLKPGMLFFNPLFLKLYLVLNIEFINYGDTWSAYYIIYVLDCNNKILGYGVSNKSITNLYDTLNWKLIT